MKAHKYDDVPWISHPCGYYSLLVQCGLIRISKWHKGHHILLEPFHPEGNPRSTMGPLRTIIEHVKSWGYLHNLIWGSRVIATKARKSSRVQGPRWNKLRVQAPKSNQLTTYHFHESSRKIQTNAPNAMTRTHKMLKSFSLKSHQRN
jgi:hypothetical protein